MENYITSELIESTYLFCAKRISDSEAAKDLSQDILLTAMQNISMGKQFVSFNSWYWRMARNKYADLIEARQMIRELPLDEALNVRDMSVQPIDALSRIDSIFAISALDEMAAPQQPYDNSVVLENVSFRYEGTEKDAIHGLDMTIRSGEHIALVGPSGGGCGLLSEFFPSPVTSHVST